MGRTEKRLGRRLANDTTTSFADDDYWTCNLVVIGQLDTTIYLLSSIGDPLGVHASRSEKAHDRRLANVTTTTFADDDYRPCNLVVIGQLIQQSNCCNLLLSITF